MEHLNALIEGQSHAVLHLDLSPAALERLVMHLRLLERWNAKLNLVAAGALEAWAVRHTLDSLALAPWLPAGGNTIDVGSGAGFPGLPLAALDQRLNVVLLEPRANRSAFLQNAVAGLRLPGVHVKTGRAEDEAGKYEFVVGRAVAKPEAWGELAGALCSETGRFALFSQEEPPATLAGHSRQAYRTYRLAGEPTRSVGLYVPRGTPANESLTR